MAFLTKTPDDKKNPIKMMDIPKDANLTDYIPLEEENNRLSKELNILRERKADEKVATETIFRLRTENNKLREVIRSAIQCLTSGNSVRVSDPRPALKYLKEGLKDG